MPELNCTYSLSHIPYVCNDELDEYGEALIADAAPDKLSCPNPIDADAFLEFYLGLSVEYHKLSYDGIVLGLTAFNRGYIQIVDEETHRPRPLLVEAGTVVIDTSLLHKQSEARLRFTLMHEAAHWLLHRKAFSEDNSFFHNQKYDNQYLAAKEGRIDYSRQQWERTDSERMERQADFLAAAMLMPKATLRNAYRDFFRYYGRRPMRVVRGKDNFHDCCARQLPEYVAKQFHVSKRAALIRLEKLGAIV